MEKKTGLVTGAAGFNALEKEFESRWLSGIPN